MSKVLIVEDQPSMAAMVRHHVENAGFDVVTATEVEGAWGAEPCIMLLFTDGTQLAAARYCFDFGCYPPDPAEFVAGHLTYYSLWYTAGRHYGLHDGEWKMTGGSENATSVLIASEPLTRDTNAWVEVPEYSMLHVALRKDRPVITIRDLD